MEYAPAEDQIVAALRRIMRAVDLHSRRLVDECGLTLPQLAALRGAARLAGPTVSALARSLHLSQPTVTGIVDRLEGRGLLRRTRDDADRRSVRIEATLDGQRLLNDAPSLLQDRFRRELTRLRSWERSMILATLQRIAEMMDAESIEAAPVLVVGPVDASTGPPDDVVQEPDTTNTDPEVLQT